MTKQNFSTLKTKKKYNTLVQYSHKQNSSRGKWSQKRAHLER